jgi:hypothetical protein
MQIARMCPGVVVRGSASFNVAMVQKRTCRKSVFVCVNTSRQHSLLEREGGKGDDDRPKCLGRHPAVGERIPVKAIDLAWNGCLPNSEKGKAIIGTT